MMPKNGLVSWFSPNTAVRAVKTKPIMPISRRATAQYDARVPAGSSIASGSTSSSPVA